MKINIICVGKIKEEYWNDALYEYIKRLAPYTKLKIVEVSDEKTSQNASLADENIIKNIEGDRLLSHIGIKDYVIALDLKGKQLSSENLSSFIENRMIYGEETIDFIIGGSIGLSDKIINRANLTLSFSKLTFPHQLMRVVLLEQIYRAFKIMKNEPYHK